MNIVFASHNAGLLGAERVLLDAAHQLTGRGHRVHIAVPRSADLARPWAQSATSLTALSLPWWMCGQDRMSPRRKLTAAARIALALPQVIAWMRRVRPDVVVSNCIVHPVAALAARALRIPHVWYVHEFGSRDHGFEFLFGDRASLTLIGRLSDCIIYNSKAVQDYFSTKIKANRSELLYCGICTPSIVPSFSAPEARLKLVVVAGLVPQKRQEDAIRAVGLLKVRGVDCELTIVGPGAGPYPKALTDLVEHLDIGDRVHFTGAMDVPFDYFAAADIALTCSRDEAFGRVTIEAMRMGTPVIGARSGGTKELIEHGFNGYLFAPRDAGDLANQIARLNADREDIVRLSRNAFDWSSQRFLMDEFGARLSCILGDVVRHRRHRRQPKRSA